MYGILPFTLVLKVGVRVTRVTEICQVMKQILAVVVPDWEWDGGSLCYCKVFIKRAFFKKNFFKAVFIYYNFFKKAVFKTCLQTSVLLFFV